MKANFWIFLFLICVAVSCLEPAEVHIIEKPVEVKYLEPAIEQAIKKVEPTPVPTPEKSACEYEVDHLKSEIDYYRQREWTQVCDCQEVDYE